jgi:uncharacterized protein with ATP-grasp and redox domains
MSMKTVKGDNLQIESIAAELGIDLSPEALGELSSLEEQEIYTDALNIMGNEDPYAELRAIVKDVAHERGIELAEERPLVHDQENDFEMA